MELYYIGLRLDVGADFTNIDELLRFFSRFPWTIALIISVIAFYCVCM